MMDAVTIEAAEAAVNANYPDGCGAVLIVELDGPVEQVAEDLAHVLAVCGEHSAREIRVASDPADRAAVWRGRKAALDRKSTRLNSSHQIISYAVFCLKKK